MTRLEAKKYTKPFIGSRSPMSMIRNDVDYCIDKIYDDFESREKELQDNIESARVKIMSNIALTNDFDKKKAYKIVNDMFKYIKDNK